MDDAAVGATEETAVGADAGHLPCNGLILFPVEVDGVVPVGQHLAVRPETVRHIGIGKNRLRPQPLQFVRMHLLRYLQQLLQVDNLMIAPIANIGPRVFRLWHLPLDAGAGDAIRIITVGGGGIEEFGDDARDVVGIGQGQRLPVLEDIAPVALVIEPR